GNPGAIVADINDGGSGNGKAGVWGANPTVSASNYNLNNYPHSYDNTWEHLAVEFNLDATDAADVTRIFRNGNLAGTTTAAQTTNLVPFINDTFYIGRRGDNTTAFFQGNIDELTIESLPPVADPPDPTIPPIANQAVKLYVMAGQSNAMGQYAPSSELPAELQGEQTDVVIYSKNPSNAGEWETLKPGILTATPQDFGPEITFGRTMADSLTSESVVLVKYAVGATTLYDDWNSTTPGPLYTGLINAVNEAVAALSGDHDVEIAGMTWMQGESDALVAIKAAAYETNFQNFVDDLRADLGVSDLPIAIGQIADDSVWTYRADVRQAVTDVVAVNSNIAEFSTDTLSTYSHHYDAQGQQDLGVLFAAAIDGIGAATSIPEPGSAAMLLTAVLSLMFFRRRGFRLLLLAGVVVSVALPQGFSSTAGADVVAQWRFEPDDTETPENEFLMDSSGNGNTLANFGVVSQTDPGAGFPGLGGAAFDGSSHMQTAATLDLSPYRHILITWWQKVANNVDGMIWEHSETFISTPGSIVADVNDGPDGNGKAGVWGTAGNLNLDHYPHSYNNTWEHLAVEINLDAADAGDILWVFRNGNLAGWASTAQTTNTVPFLNDIFYLGARGGSSVHFTGAIDELVIQTVPEPGAIALLLTVVLSLAFPRRRSGCYSRI
ncbi:MAG: sialate O-acetylesterase, partial [Planctomycetota bacterium]|nr:sialate O-acetylesterase [Planctomycetota bacterium]